MVSDRQDVTPGMVKEFLWYDPRRGTLTWKPRARKWFKTDRSCSVWNTKNANRPAARRHSNDYLTVKIFGFRFAAGRVAWCHFHGKWPSHHIDHINGKRGQNDIENLRDVPRRINNRNTKRRSDNKSGATLKDEIRGKELVMSHNDEVREKELAQLTALREENEQKHSDIGILISMIEGLEEATGEGPEEEDGVIFAQIKKSHDDEIAERRKAPEADND